MKHLGAISGAVLGVLLASMGYGLLTWQFYAIFACAIGIALGALRSS